LQDADIQLLAKILLDVSRKHWLRSIIAPRFVPCADHRTPSLCADSRFCTSISAWPRCFDL